MTNLLHQYHATVPNLHHKVRLWRFVSTIVLVAFLSACAEETSTPDDRRFANQEPTETAEVAAPIPPDAQASPVSAPTAVPLASPESLLQSENAPSVVFALLDGTIAVIDITGSTPARQISAPDGSAIVAIAQSPSESKVAALIVPTGDRVTHQLEVVIYDEKGEPLERWADLLTSRSDVATPAPVAAEVAYPDASISWSPDGARLLVAAGDSHLVNIELGGQASPLQVPAPVTRVASAAWSPQGNQVAVLARNRDGGGAIWVFSPYVDGESMRQVAPPNADAADLGSVSRFAWLPDSSGFAFLLTDAAGAGGGGQLYTVNIKLGIKLLVATAGRGGPAAGIIDFTLSPDGGSVAYTIAIPVGDEWQFHSLWVRSMQAPIVYGVPVGNAERVGNVWWTATGLAWEQQSGEPVDIVVQAPGATPQIVFTSGLAGVGTPGATPALPGAATPVATPIVATPAVATPAG